jgi:hypothetical protein
MSGCSEREAAFFIHSLVSATTTANKMCSKNKLRPWSIKDVMAYKGTVYELNNLLLDIEQCFRYATESMRPCTVSGPRLRISNPFQAILCSIDRKLWGRRRWKLGPMVSLTEEQVAHLERRQQLCGTVPSEDYLI